MYYANPPEDWLKINNFKLREQHRIEIIEGVRKGPLWNAVYLLYQGDVFNKDVSNPYRHKLVAPYYEGAKQLIAIHEAENEPTVDEKYLIFMRKTAASRFLSQIGFRNDKRTSPYTEQDILNMYSLECMLDEVAIEQGEQKAKRSNTEIFALIAKRLGFSAGHIKRAILKGYSSPPDSF